MITVKNEGIILEKTNLKFENKGVLNPACIQVDDITHMFYRAVNHNNISSIGYCQLKDNKVVKRLKEPVLFPEYEYEKMGVEDPRIVFLDGIYYLFYTAYDGRNALIAYATSKDIVHFAKQGLISPKISYFAFPHRILPGIQIIYFNNFSELTKDRWRDYLKNLGDFVVLDPLFWFENRNVGGGCPPIETKDGWLIIYHAVKDTPLGKIYHAAAALLDLKNPLRVLGRLTEPLFSPKAPWEKSGITNNIVFPTGAVVRGKRLYIYYGAADTVIAAKSVDLAELLTELKKTP